MSAEVHAEIVGEELAAAAAAEEKAADKKDDKKKDDKKKDEAKMEVEDDASKPSLSALYEKLKAAHGRGAFATATLVAAYGANPPLPLFKETYKPDGTVVPPTPKMEEAYV